MGRSFWNCGETDLGRLIIDEDIIDFVQGVSRPTNVSASFSPTTLPSPAPSMQDAEQHRQRDELFNTKFALLVSKAPRPLTLDRTLALAQIATASSAPQLS